MHTLAKKSAGFINLAARARDRLSSDRGPFDGLRRAFYAQLWERTAAAAGARLEPLGREYFRVSRGSAVTFLRRSDLMLDSPVVLRLAGDKPLCLRLFGEADLPVPRYVEFDLDSIDRAWSFAQDLGRPVVVKPARAGSAGRGVATGVTSRSSLRRAAWFAAAHGNGGLCEEQLEGASYRLLYLDGRLIDAVRRDPPHVEGDGTRSIRELLRDENQARRAEPITSLHPLRDDRELRGFLHETGRALTDIPVKGERLQVKRPVNENAARENVRVTESLHPSVIEVGRRAAAALRVRLAGVDLLTPDPSQPLEEVGGIVGEVNTAPGLHHHVLTSGPEPDPSVPLRVLEHLLERDGG